MEKPYGVILQIVDEEKGISVTSTTDSKQLSDLMEDLGVDGLTAMYTHLLKEIQER